MGITIDITRVACETTAAPNTQDVTLSLGGLTPKASMFILTLATANDTLTTDAMLAYGFSDGTDHIHAGYYDEDGQSGSTVLSSWGRGSEALRVYHADGTLLAEADNIDFSANTVSIDWSDEPPAGYLITVVAFAGSDLTAKVVPDATLPSTAGDSITVTPNIESDVIFGLKTASYLTSAMCLGLSITAKEKYSYSLEYDYKTGSSSTDPGTGYVQAEDGANFDNNDEWHINDTDRNSVDQSAVLDQIAVGDLIVLRSEATATIVQIAKVASISDEGGWHKIIFENTGGAYQFNMYLLSTDDDVTISSMPPQYRHIVYGRNARATSEAHGGIAGIDGGYGESILNNWRYSWDIYEITSTTFKVRNSRADRTGRHSGWLSLNFGGAADYALYTYTTPTATGNDDDEGAGFEPQFLMYLLNTMTAEYSWFGSGVGGPTGVAAITDNDQYSNAISVEDDLATTNTNSIAVDQSMHILEDDGTDELEATHVSMLSTGIRHNITTAPASALVLPALAIEAEAGEPATGLPERKHPRGIARGILRGSL